MRVVGADESQLLLPLGPTAVLSMSLGRTTRFTTAEIGALCFYQPWVLPLMRHVVLAIPQPVTYATPTGGPPRTSSRSPLR